MQTEPSQKLAGHEKEDGKQQYMDLSAHTQKTSNKNNNNNHTWASFSSSTHAAMLLEQLQLQTGQYGKFKGENPEVWWGDVTR